MPAQYLPFYKLDALCAMYPAKNEGHHPFKKVIGQNTEFLCKILHKLNYTFLGLYGEIYQSD
jgi:hypothetical protein